jgi:eukaryotic-like serine/threonine-protein kinase
MSSDIPGTIGPYEILDTLGRGATSVFKARREGDERGVVAVKLFPASYGDDSAWVERFRHDVAALSALAHPNIVRVFESGMDQGRPYLVMEHVQAVSLQTLMADRRLTLAEAIHVVKGVAHALECVHGAGLVHMDINPRSILVTPELAGIKLGDFGASRALPVSRVPGTLTQAEMSADTVPYRPPEQFRNAAVLDARGDIYSLGAVFYRMLTGHVPTGKIGIPSQLNSAVPNAIDPIVLRCLQPSPAKRFENVAGLIEALGDVERNLGLQIVSELEGIRRSTSHLVGRTASGLVGRYRAATYCAGGVLAVAAALALYSSRSQPAAPSAVGRPATGTVSRPAAPVPASQAAVPGADAPASAAARPQAASSPKAPASAPKRRDAASAVDGTPAAPAVAAARTGGSNDAAAARALEAARSKLEAKSFDLAFEDLEAFLVTYRDNRLAFDALVLLGRLHEQCGRPAQAAAAYRAAATRSPSDPRSAEALFRLAQLTLQDRGHEQEARQHLADIADRFPGTPWTLSALSLKQDLEERLKLEDKDPATGARTPAWVATARELVGQFPERPPAEAALWKLGNHYQEAKAYEQAARAFEQLGGRFPRTTLDAWFRAGEIYEKQLHQPADARRAYLAVPASSRKYADSQRRAAKLK